ncbi:MAG: Ig-like domain-containing protein [Dehalococcoidia bacterium]
MEQGTFRRSGLLMKRRWVRLLVVAASIALLFPSVLSSITTQAQSNTQSTPSSAVAVSPDGAILAVAGDDGGIAVWDVATGLQLHLLSAPGQGVIHSLTFNSKGTKLASAGADSVVRIWDVASGRLLHALQGHGQGAKSVAFGADDKRLATGGDDTKVLLWDVETGRLLSVSSGNKDSVEAVAFSPEGKEIASGSGDGVLREFNVATGRETRSRGGTGRSLTAIAFSKDGTKVAVADEDGTVTEWDRRTGSSSRANGERGVRGLAYGNDGKLKKGKAGISSDGEVTADMAADGTVSLKDNRRAGTDRTFRRQGAAPGPRSGARDATTAPETTPSAAFRDQAAGASILIITSTGASNPFGTFYAEMLRNEGLNDFSVADIATVNAATLLNYDVVLLAELAPSAAQVTMLSDWVTAGGNLIAMRPATQLGTLLGLSAPSGTLTNGYLLVDTATAAGAGIVAQTMQFKGTADRYALNGASTVATLYSNATTATANPAVTLRNVGAQGGQAAAFSYDLARSVVYQRQGNPAWVDQERDGVTPGRSSDLYYGAASGDVQPDWIDLTKVAIPQADEQQRLLANMITRMNADRAPLPRFWYLPRGLKAAVVMTGDDHGNGGTAPRFDQFIAASPAGCSVANWECIRGTSYIYTTTPLTNAQAVAYQNQGFEIGLHLTTNCGNYTEAQFTSFWSSQLSDWQNKYSGLAAPSTNRTHCIAWSGWTVAPTVERAFNVRFDTNYYYWPPAWLADRPGFFTGSGMPMRFSALDGSIVDIYQATSQMTDESGQSYPFTPNTLLDRALGPEGYYGVFTVNAHTDVAFSNEADTVVAAAKARGVPVVTSKQMLTWLDGRNSSTFSGVTWSGSTLSFSVTQGAGANGLQAMVPFSAGGGSLTSLTLNGVRVAFTSQSIKGTVYAFFNAATGSVVATYGVDSTPPTVTANSPLNGATGVAVGMVATATFSEDMDATTISTATFELRNPANALVPATVAYNAATRVATLTPSAPLAANTVYTARVLGGGADPRAKDLVGNALAANVSWSFTTTADTGPACPCSIWASSAIPATITVNDASSVVLGVKFTSDVAGYISGIRFYKGPSNTGIHTGKLWTAAGVELANVTFSGETASGWQQATFASPVLIAANTTYIASYQTTVGFYSANGNYFGAATDNPPLHALSNAAGGGNGVYLYSAAHGFPSNTFGATNYWVDVVFVTSAGPDNTPPTVTANTPLNGATGVALGSAVTATFSEDMDLATISGATFELRTPANALVAAIVTYNAATRVATLTPSAPLTVNTTYTATVLGGAADPRAKDLAGNALAANASWSFTTIVGDNTPPTVTANSPLNGATGVGTATTVTATFSEDMDAATISSTTFELRNPANALVAATVSYSAATRVATLTPSAPLAATTTYTASVLGGAADPRAKDLAGNALAATASWSFTTAAGPACPCSIWAPSATPSTITENDASSVVLGVKFTSDVAGYVSGIRFYKGPSNTGIHTGKLWTAAGVELANVTFSGETGSGWQEATFAAPVLIAANTTYIASYHAPVGFYSVNANYFGAATDNPPLHALSNAAGGGNGVYLYGAGHAFPSSSFQASNYWVDVVFVTSIAGDNTPPTVTANAPLNGATGVALGSAVTATFSEDMDLATISGSTFELRNPANALVAATVTYNAATRVATLTPSAPLATNTTYTARVLGGATDPRAKDLAGNALAANATWSFTTIVGDNTPPTVTANSPLNGATGVGTGTTVTATFSEDMDAATISTATFELRNPANALVTATVSYSAATRVATLTPSAPLAANTTYTASVLGGAADPRAKDLAGNALAATASWSFTTAAVLSRSISFDGTNDYVTVPDAASLDIGSTVTIETFAKPTATPNSRRGLVAKTTWEVNVIAPTFGAGVRFEFRTRTTANGTFRTITTGNFPLNQWYHVAATYNGTTMRLFVNGVQQGTGRAATGTIDSNTALVMGSTSAGAGRFPGLIDEVRVSNIVRYAANFTPTAVAFAPDADTRALWHFNEGTGTTAADVSGNANTGTLTSGPTWSTDVPVL